MTPVKQLEQHLEALDGHVARLPKLLGGLEDVVEDSGTPVIAQEGIEDGRAERWTQTFVSAMTVVSNHQRTHNNRYGSLAEPEEDDSDLPIDSETENNS
jgi:truncated hemoglobin YjbI